MSAASRLWRSWPGRIGLVFLGLVACTVILSYLWVPHDPLRPEPTQKWLGISADHLFGTGGDGKDLFSGVVVGSRVSMFVAVTSALIAGAIGITLGVASAIAPRLVGESLAYLIDILIAIPTLVLALVLLGLFGGSLFTVSLALGFASGVVFARIIRAEAMRVLAQDYIVAAHASGTSTLRTIVRHVLPNIAPIAVVQLSIFAGLAVVAEASLSFLGLTSLAHPSWGRTLSDLKNTVTLHPGPVAFPGVALVISALGFNLLGDGLRDVMDPRLRTSQRVPHHATRAADVTAAAPGVQLEELAH